MSETLISREKLLEDLRARYEERLLRYNNRDTVL